MLPASFRRLLLRASNFAYIPHSSSLLSLCVVTISLHASSSLGSLSLSHWAHPQQLSWSTFDAFQPRNSEGARGALHSSTVRWCRGLPVYLPHRDHHRFTPGSAGRSFFFVDGNGAFSLGDYDSHHCGLHYPSYTRGIRSLPCSDDTIPRTELLQIAGLGRATEVQYRGPCWTHVPNRRMETSAPYFSIQKQPRLLCVSAQCLPRNSHLISDGQLPTPPEILH